jgi:hypothetical protein
VSSVRLPLFGYGLALGDGQLDLSFNARVTGSRGEAAVRADFVDGTLVDAYLITAKGSTIPLVVMR